MFIPVKSSLFIWSTREIHELLRHGFHIPSKGMPGVSRDCSTVRVVQEMRDIFFQICIDGIIIRPIDLHCHHANHGTIVPRSENLVLGIPVPDRDSKRWIDKDIKGRGFRASPTRYCHAENCSTTSCSESDDYHVHDNLFCQVTFSQCKSLIIANTSSPCKMVDNR